METIRELISVSFLSVSNVWFVMLYHFSIESPLTLGRTFSHTPTVVQGLIEPPWNLICCIISKQFAFGGNPLIFSTRWGILNLFMGGGSAEGLWRHQTWSPSWPPSWILSRIRNQVKTVTPATYDVLSHNHSKWPPLKVSQNAREG